MWVLVSHPPLVFGLVLLVFRSALFLLVVVPCLFSFDSLVILIVKGNKHFAELKRLLQSIMFRDYHYQLLLVEPALQLNLLCGLLAEN